jgi:hypothetical protein
MKTFTKKQKQWLWFAALCSGGFVAALLLANLVRWTVYILP